MRCCFDFSKQGAVVLALGAAVFLSSCKKHESTPAERIAALRKAEVQRDAAAKAQAIAELQEMGAAAVPMEAAILSDSNPSLRQAAVDLLSHNGDPALMPTLEVIGHYSRDADDSAEMVFANLLPASTQFLQQQLKSSDRTHKTSAIWALGHDPRVAKQSEAAQPALVAILRGSDPDLRIFATDSIGKIGNATGHVETEVLQEALHDPTPQIRLFAAQGLGINPQDVMQPQRISRGRSGVHPYFGDPQTLWPPTDQPSLRTKPGTEAAAIGAMMVMGRRCDDWLYVADWAREHHNTSLQGDAERALHSAGSRIASLYSAEWPTQIARELLVQLGQQAVQPILDELLKQDVPELRKVLDDIGQPAADLLIQELRAGSSKARLAIHAFATEDNLAKCGNAAMPLIDARYDHDERIYHEEDIDAVVRIGHQTGYVDLNLLNRVSLESSTAAGSKARQALDSRQPAARDSQSKAALDRARATAANAATRYQGKAADAWFTDYVEEAKRSGMPYPQNPPAVALKQLGVGALPTLVAALMETDPARGDAAERALQLVHLPESAGPVAELLGFPDFQVAHRAYNVLFSLRSAGVAALRESLGSPLLARRRNAVEILGLLQGNEIASALRELQIAESDADMRVREGALKAIGKIPGAPASDVAARAATNELNSSAPQLRRAAVEALGPKVDDLQSLEKLRRSETAGTLRGAARAKYAAICDRYRSHVPALISALNDSDREVRAAAVSQLRNLGPIASEAAIPLAKMATDPKQLGAGTQIWTALSEVGPSAVPELVKHIADPNPNIRRGVVQTLEHYGQGASAAVPALIQRLNANEPGEPGETAIRALGAIGPLATDALPALNQVVASGNSVRAQMARSAISRILRDPIKQVAAPWAPSAPQGDLALPPKFADATALPKARAVLDEMTRLHAAPEPFEADDAGFWRQTAMQYAKIGEYPSAIGALKRYGIPATRPARQITETAPNRWINTMAPAPATRRAGTTRSATTNPWATAPTTRPARTFVPPRRPMAAQTRPAMNPIALKSDMALLTEAALATLKRGDSAQAAKIWIDARALLPADPNTRDAAPWELLAVSYAKAHNLSAAAEILDNFPELLPTRGAIEQVVAICLEGRDLDNAESLARSIVWRDPRNRALLAVARALEKASQSARALACYERILDRESLNPREAEPAIDGEIRLGSLDHVLNAVIPRGEGIFVDQMRLHVVEYLSSRGDVVNAAKVAGAITEAPMKNNALADLQGARSNVILTPPPTAEPRGSAEMEYAIRKLRNSNFAAGDAAAKDDVAAIDRLLAPMVGLQAFQLRQDAAAVFILWNQPDPARRWMKQAMAIRNGPQMPDPDSAGDLLNRLHDAELHALLGERAEARQEAAQIATVLRNALPAEIPTDGEWPPLMLELARLQVMLGRESGTMAWSRQLSSPTVRERIMSTIVDGLIDRANGVISSYRDPR